MRRRWTRGSAQVAMLFALALPLAGCGDDATPTRPTEVASLSPAQDLGTPLPSGWPQVTLPEGSSVTDTVADGGRLEVDFESQQLANAVAAFLDAQLTSAGFQKGASSTEGDTVTTSYASGPSTAKVTLVETGGTTTGSVEITTEASDGPTSSPASPSAS